MNTKKKLYTLFAKYEATVPIATVAADSEAEALKLGEQIPLDNVKMCPNCQNIFGEGDLDTDLDVEEVDGEDIIAPILEIIDTTKDSDTVVIEIDKDEANNANKINISETNTFAGSRRSYKITEATPLSKSNENIPEHIQPYLMTEEEIEKDKEEKLKENQRPYYQSYDQAYD